MCKRSVNRERSCQPRTVTQVVLGKRRRRARAPGNPRLWRSPGGPRSANLRACTRARIQPVPSRPAPAGPSAATPAGRGCSPARRCLAPRAVRLPAYLRAVGLRGSGLGCAGLHWAALGCAPGLCAPRLRPLLAWLRPARLRPAVPRALAGGPRGAGWARGGLAGWRRRQCGSGPPRSRLEAPYLGSDVRGSRRGRTTHFFPFTPQSFLSPSPGSPSPHAPGASPLARPQPSRLAAGHARVAALGGHDGPGRGGRPPGRVCVWGIPTLARELGGSVRRPPP